MKASRIVLAAAMGLASAVIASAADIDVFEDIGSETWTGDNVYHIWGVITVHAGLDIEGGVRVVGEDEGDLVIQGGARIVASGPVGDTNDFSVRFDTCRVSGDGTLETTSDAVLLMEDCDVSCVLTGSGTVSVSVGRTLTLSGLARANPTRFECFGSLIVKDEARLFGTSLYAVDAVFSDDAIVTDCDIEVGDLPPGQLRLRHNARFEHNTVNARSDGYLYLDHPLGFEGVVADNRIHVTVPADQRYLTTDLLEVRGEDFYGFGETPGIYPAPVPEGFGDGYLNVWWLESLTLEAGATLVLADRFEDQNADSPDVMYVRTLVRGRDSVLDVGSHVLYYEILEEDVTSTQINRTFLGSSLATIDFDVPDQFLNVLQFNTFEEEDHVRFDREVMRMRNFLAEGTLASFARVKAEFPRMSAEQVLVRLSYRFERPVPGAELVVYVTDDPRSPAELEPVQAGELDPSRYREVGRIPIPGALRPGAPGATALATFEGVVSTEGLNLSEGTWVHLELIQPFEAGFGFRTSAIQMADAHSPPAEVTVDDLDVEIFCNMNGGGCLDWDVNNSQRVNEIDFLTMIAVSGFRLDDIPNIAASPKSCAEAFFCADGYADLFDVFGFDYLYHESGCVINFGALPAGLGILKESQRPSDDDRFNPRVQNDSMVTPPANHLLVLGKNFSEHNGPGKVKDGLYVLDPQLGGSCAGRLFPSVDHGNVRLVQGLGGELYRIDVKSGVVLMGPGARVVVPVGTDTPSEPDPRFGRSATVMMGIQPVAASLRGRPILDAAFDKNDPRFVYVVPVVVDPIGTGPSGRPYLAAAKLELHPNNPTNPYDVVRLYDSPYHDCNDLREIEVNSDGTVFVLNADSTTQGDVLIKYSNAGTVLAYLEAKAPVRIIYPGTGTSRHLPEVNDLSDPIAMHLSTTTRTLFLTSALYNPPNINISTIYGFSADNLTVQRSITIEGMQHVAGITEGPGAEGLWIVGYTMDLPEAINDETDLFYLPYWANVRAGDTEVQAEEMPLDVCGELALPTSVAWQH